MIKKFAILGERCSGTNYLMRLVEKNFGLQYTDEYGFKHFDIFYNEYKNSDDCLFIGIVRNPVNWLNSFYNNPWHVSYETAKNSESFLNNIFYSRVIDKPYLCVNPITREKTLDGWEMEADFNFKTKKKYKNVFECRYTKLEYLMWEMQNRVKNYYFLRYEDIVQNLNNEILNIKNKFKIPTNQQFVLNNITYKNTKKIYKKIKYTTYSEMQITSHVDYKQSVEEALGYVFKKK